MKEVELHEAFMWLCPSCAKKNFNMAINMEMSPEEKKELLGFDPWEEAPKDDIKLYPEIVKCERCKKRYKAKLDDYEDDED